MEQVSGKREKIASFNGAAMFISGVVVVGIVGLIALALLVYGFLADNYGLVIGCAVIYLGLIRYLRIRVSSAGASRNLRSFAPSAAVNEERRSYKVRHCSRRICSMFAVCCEQWTIRTLKAE